MTADDLKLVAKLRQQRRDNWGLDLPDKIIPAPRLNWWPAVYILAMLAVIATGIRW